MKRHHFDELDLDVLSERSFAKRLKIDEQISIPEASFMTHKCHPEKKETYTEPEQWLKATGRVCSEPKFNALNVTLRELHQQRGERKLLKKSEGPLTSLLIPDQSESRSAENAPTFYPYGTASTDFPGSKYSWASSLRKQQQFQREYEARCRFELLSDHKRGGKSGTGLSRLGSTAEDHMQQSCPRHQSRQDFIPYSPQIPHQDSWNSMQGIPASSNYEDQMEID